MIHAAAWFCEAHCGIWTPAGNRALRRDAPALAATDEVTALLGRPVKYFSRMTAEAQMGLCAMELALRGAGWRDEGTPEREIGVLAAGFAGCLTADRQYFDDYVASGRKLGRASLFVYTLPTSAACAAAMAPTLTGPVLHVHDDAHTLPALVRSCEGMVADAEAGGMLALWSDPRAAVCLAVGAAAEIGYPSFLQALRSVSPWPLAQELHALMSAP